jgi:hypothetical protein
MALGTVLSALLIVAAFMVNRNIFNSDNYRYLIFLLTPWSLGFGLLTSSLPKRGLPGRAGAGILVAVLMSAMTSTTIGWYREDLGYLDARWRCVRIPQLVWSEIPVWSRRQHDLERRVAFVVPPDVTHVFGDYWDVYRMAFLSGNRITGIPHPIYPNRFPGWSRGLGAGQGELLAIGVRREWGSRAPKRRSQTPFGPPSILEPPGGNEWKPPFRMVWQNDGRDPAELDLIPVILPSSDRARR